MHFNPFISQTIAQIYTVKSFDFSSETNNKMPYGIMDGRFSTVFEQGTYSGRSKVILLNASSTKFQLHPTPTPPRSTIPAPPLPKILLDSQ